MFKPIFVFQHPFLNNAEFWRFQCYAPQPTLSYIQHDRMTTRKFFETYVTTNAICYGVSESAFGEGFCSHSALVTYMAECWVIYQRDSEVSLQTTKVKEIIYSAQEAKVKLEEWNQSQKEVEGQGQDEDQTESHEGQGQTEGHETQGQGLSQIQPFKIQHLQAETSCTWCKVDGELSNTCMHCQFARQCYEIGIRKTYHQNCLVCQLPDHVKRFAVQYDTKRKRIYLQMKELLESQEVLDTHSNLIKFVEPIRTPPAGFEYCPLFNEDIENLYPKVQQQQAEPQAESQRIGFRFPQHRLLAAMLAEQQPNKHTYNKKRKNQKESHPTPNPKSLCI